MMRLPVSILVALLTSLLAAPTTALAVPPNIDGSMKVELLEALAGPPGVVWLGSSTSREVDPVHLRELTGRSAFNAALSAARPTQSRYFARQLARIFPERYPHLVVGLDLEQFRIEHDRPIRRRPAGASPSALSRFRFDGFRMNDPYAGRGLRLTENIAHYKAIVYPRMRRLNRTQLRALDEFIAIANKHGDTPTIVLNPVHPKFAAAMRPLGRAKRMRELRQWLVNTKAKGRTFRVVDMTSLRAYGGSPSAFYDGVHQRPDNIRKLVVAVDRADGFKREL